MQGCLCYFFRSSRTKSKSNYIDGVGDHMIILIFIKLLLFGRNRSLVLLMQH